MKTNQRHRQYWDETHNGQTRITSSIGIRHRMDKPVTQAVLRQDTKGTNLRHMRYSDRTHNGLIRGTCSIETRLRIVKPEKQIVLRQDI
jgi:hypothetical protein